MQYQQYIIATGGVGVGKSTLINKLTKYLPKDETIYIEEYVDYNPNEAKKQLEETLKGTGSVYQFQLSILDCYREQIEKAKNKKFIIMERSPADSINIFAKASYLKGKMSDEEYNDLLKKVDELNKKYNIPQLTEYNFRRIDSCIYSVQEVFSIARKDIDDCLEKQQSCLFLLYCSDPFVQKNNIEKRGRAEEKDYDINYMISVNNEYTSLFASF